MTFIPTRAAGLDRLSNFIPRAGRAYAGKRNFDFGPDDRSNVSGLSPYTRTRLVSEPEIVDTTLEHHSMQEAEKFIQEVFWRTYFKGRLEREPHIWARCLKETEALRSELPGTALGKRYKKAVEGLTGISGFDDWARELTTHNYLHNHARMWFASIWIFTLNLPWQLGADFFMQHLLDGDPASNTLSWRWVAGLHTKGKTYLARTSNIEKFTAGRFAPGGLSEQACPLQDPDDDITPRPVPAGAPAPEQPFVWLYHEDDLSAPAGTPAQTAGLVLTPPPGQSAAVTAFRRASVKDAAQCRAAGNADDLIDLCRKAGVDHIVMPYAPVGYVADTITDMRPALSEAGLNLHIRVRDWDRLTWPYATAGFFKVKKKIPRILDGLDQGILL